MDLIYSDVLMDTGFDTMETLPPPDPTPDEPLATDQALKDWLALAGEDVETPVDDVFVVGTRRDQWDYFWDYQNLINDLDTGGDNNAFIDAGGGSWGDTGYSACTDRKSDTLAATFNDKLATKPDANIREYGAILWKDAAGNVHMTELFPGNIDSNGYRWLPEFTDAFLATHGVPSVGSIVGVIHSHPTHYVAPGGGVGAPRNVGDLASLPSGYDWNESFRLVGRGASLENFSMYISYNGVITEFDLRDNLSVDKTPQGPGRGIASGGYNPGQSCP